MKNKLVKEGYDKIAENYLTTRDIFKSEKYLDEFIELVPKNRTILDVGCGAGIPIDNYLVEKGFAVNGIDISEKQIKLAQKNVPQAFYEVKDMLDLKEGEYCVDGIVSFYAIFHTPKEEHEGIFEKFASFLSTGDPILVSMGSKDWEGEEDFFGANMFWSHFGADKNIEIVKNAGFEIILNEIDTSGGEKHQMIIARKV